MTKTELIKQVAKKSDMSQKDTDVVLKNFFEVVKNTVKSGEKVAVIGFGNFEARKRASRTGVNPKTRKKMTIPAKVVPVFRPGKAFKEAVAKK
ncbi:MAG: HU family DNA-binding protein [Caldisericia bacterium]|jgi:DNA-binding protein HU-beta|nr:HU family DNA-binding protein [Caldisericia bacterium]MDD4614217.1 HU family DNA-binding protein [Caldisericia bacterium]